MAIMTWPGRTEEQAKREVMGELERRLARLKISGPANMPHQPPKDEVPRCC